MKRVVLSVLALAVVSSVGAACGTMAKEEPFLSMTASPSKIDDKGMMAATINIETTNELVKPGTGTVTLSTPAGTLGATSLTLDATGKASTTFTCNFLTDANCTGRVKISGSWDYKGVTYTSSTSIQVGTAVVPDAGNKPDSGNNTDGGSGFDAGMDGMYKIVLTPEKLTLVAATGDKAQITAKVTLTTTGQPASAVNLKFTTSAGSFAATAGTTTKDVMTDAQGNASVYVFVAGSPEGPFDVNAVAADSSKAVQLNILGVASIQHEPSGPTPTKSVLGVVSSGQQTTTPIWFQVKNAAQKGVPGVAVNFSVSGVAGASVTTPGVTDANGLVSTTLSSGNSVGTAIVTAVVAATAGQVPEIKGQHPGTPISGGKPSDERIQVTCTRKNIGAMTIQNPPRPGVGSQCQAYLIDRNSNQVGVPTSVQWFAEAGGIVSPVTSNASGIAVTDFTAAGSLPKEVPAAGPDAGWPQEPTLGNNNPRDMLVTIIAVMGGEEAFWDGSGTQNGNKNGKWDPGEWFVDLPEPFVDANDNNKYDDGETFFDTDRSPGCDAQGNPLPAEKPNGKWDPANGCWDATTQIWRPIHILYSGVPDIATLQHSPASPSAGLPIVTTSIADSYWNGISTDGAGIAALSVPANWSVVTHDYAGESWGGHGLAYTIDDVTEGTVGMGDFVTNGACDYANPVTSVPTVPVKRRCIRRFKFTSWGKGNFTTFSNSGAFSPSTSGSVCFNIGHMYFTGFTGCASWTWGP